MSVYYDILAAAQTAVRGAGLAGIPSGQVYLRKLPTDRDVSLPCVLVSLPLQASVTLPGVTNRSDDVGYPFLVTVVAAANQTLAVLDTELTWFQQIRQAFHERRLAGVASVYHCVVEGGQPIDATLFQQNNLTVMAWQIRAFSREARSG